MIVEIDGKRVQVDNSVKIIWLRDADERGEEQTHLTATHEGIVVDDIDENGEVTATCSQLIDDLRLTLNLDR